MLSKDLKEATKWKIADARLDFPPKKSLEKELSEYKKAVNIAQDCIEAALLFRTRLDRFVDLSKILTKSEISKISKAEKDMYRHAEAFSKALIRI